MTILLQDLSTEILLNIFEYCNIRDLLSLQKSCIRFFNIIYNATTLGNTVPILITNQLHHHIRNRSTELLTIYQKSRLSYNWKNGIYQEYSFLKESKKFIPWILLTKDNLWISKGNVIRVYDRSRNDFISKQSSFCITSPTKADISKFAYKQNRLVSGQHDGSLLLCDSNNEIAHYKNCHQSDIHTVDIEGCIIASGSKDGVIKIWNFDNFKPHLPSHTHDLNDRIWSTAFSNGGQFLAIGTAANTVAPFHYIDLNRPDVLQKFDYSFRRGSGILHIKWESPNVLLSCGYDKNVRMWDIRSKRCVNSWEDPFYSTVYCFESDNCCSIVAGTQYYGRAVLWDIRIKNYVQVYFMHSCQVRNFSSPIYSLSFDVKYLYAATDRYLNILDFSIKGGTSRNYSNFFGSKLVQLGRIRQNVEYPENA